jgi:hypothetical protein
MKTTSWVWAMAVGVLCVVVQILIFFIRFERWNTEATFTDYLLFFLAGTLGGLILIYFLNKQTSVTQRWVVLILFLLASPIALLFMLGGGLLGPLGVLIFPQIPWVLVMWIGSWMGKRFVQAG